MADHEIELMPLIIIAHFVTGNNKKETCTRAQNASFTVLCCWVRLTAIICY